MKLLDGKELAEFIKEKQAHEVRGLRSSHGIVPKLAIVMANNDPVIDVYVRLKQAYAEDILIDTQIYKVAVDEVAQTISGLNDDKSVAGIILQLPLSDTSRTDELVKRIAPEKDVDGLGSDKFFTPATAMAIDWLANGHNINLSEKKIAIVGFQGRLVGKPLMKLWAKYNPKGFDSGSDLSELKNYDLIVSATGVPGLIESDLVGVNSVIIDAGTTSENGKIAGDAASELYERDDLTITPTKGGVGPLTIAALMDNVIRASSMKKAP